MADRTGRMGARTGNRLVAVGLVGLIAAMIALTAESTTLYRLFCAATGFGGTTRRAAAVPAAMAVGRTVTVRFDANVNGALPWRFGPLADRVAVTVGQPQLAYFYAENTSAEAVTGQATFNVTPNKAGPYFVKTQCFCFNNQVLGAGQRAEMPVSFYIDPAILADRNLDDVNTITLSYTFFRAKPTS